MRLPQETEGTQETQETKRKRERGNTMRNVCGFVLLAALNLVVCRAVAADLRVGVGRADITPPLGIPMAGYYHERGADGVLDPLSSKAMVIESDGERAAFVVLDL